MSSAVPSGQDIIRELLNEGCVTVLTHDELGDAVRTRLFPSGDVINFIRPDVLGSHAWASHVAAVEAHALALDRLVRMSEKLFAWLRIVPLAVAFVFTTASGLAGLEPYFWPFAMVLGWGLARLFGAKLVRYILDRPA